MWGTLLEVVEFNQQIDGGGTRPSLLPLGICFSSLTLTLVDNDPFHLAAVVLSHCSIR